MRKDGKVRRTWKGRRKGEGPGSGLEKENVGRADSASLSILTPTPSCLPSRLQAVGSRKSWLFSRKVKILGQAWELNQAARSTDLICQPLAGDVVAKAVADDMAVQASAE